MPIVGHVGNNDHLLRGWVFITYVCVWRAGEQQFCRGGGGGYFQIRECYLGGHFN